MARQARLECSTSGKPMKSGPVEAGAEYLVGDGEKDLENEDESQGGDKVDEDRVKLIKLKGGVKREIECRIAWCTSSEGDIVSHKIPRPSLLLVSHLLRSHRLT